MSVAEPGDLVTVTEPGDLVTVTGRFQWSSTKDQVYLYDVKKTHILIVEKRFPVGTNVIFDESYQSMIIANGYAKFLGVIGSINGYAGDGSPCICFPHALPSAHLPLSWLRAARVEDEAKSTAVVEEFNKKERAKLEEKEKKKVERKIAEKAAEKKEREQEYASMTKDELLQEMSVIVSYMQKTTE